MKQSISKNKRRGFMKILGMGAVVTASSAFAAKSGWGGSNGRTSKETIELSQEQKIHFFISFKKRKLQEMFILH